MEEDHRSLWFTGTQAALSALVLDHYGYYNLTALLSKTRHIDTTCYVDAYQLFSNCERTQL